jgi:hypothetical protein
VKKAFAVKDQAILAAAELVLAEIKSNPALTKAKPGSAGMC